ncbi:DsrE family protein [Haladaptatus salinisoli]|uniref:DsrE family protein n=1 Tax=Haladaptatus salinisoli TaxID=2884876 RepID=UPI001D0AA813|nr:DsrE family protein [Haladaptatus salinisoli]
MKTVFHVSSVQPADQREAMVNALNLIADQSVSSPDDDVAIVANAAGVRMFVSETAADREMIKDLLNQDVSLRACRNALRGMGASDDDLLSGVEGVPTGSGELARLQDEGYGYVKAP